MKYVLEVKYNMGEYRTLHYQFGSSDFDYFTVTTIPGLLTYWDGSACFVFQNSKLDILQFFKSPAAIGYYYDKLIPELQPAAKKFDVELFRINLESYFEKLILRHGRDLVRDVFEEWIELSRTDPKTALAAAVESEDNGKPWLPGFGKLENAYYTSSFRLACDRLHYAAVKFPWKEQP